MANKTMHHVIIGDDTYEIVDQYAREHGGEGAGVPTEVRQAILALFRAGAYAETGLTDEIAMIESWATDTQYSITNTLSNVSNSNSLTFVGENLAYHATLTTNAGYVFDSVSITMGGVDITNQVFTPNT